MVFLNQKLSRHVAISVAHGQANFVLGMGSTVSRVEVGAAPVVVFCLLKVGDVVSVKAKSRDSEKFNAIFDANGSRPVPEWLDLNRETLEAKVVALPTREQIAAPVEEHLIVEFYSK